MAERIVKPLASVLLVDDDAPFRTILSGELEHLGYRVEVAENGAGALSRVRNGAADVMLLDLRLPDMNGLDVLKEMRARNVPTDVIVLTGHGSIDTAIEAIRIGAFDYVAKPCPLGELELRITRALERQSLRRRTQLLERALTPADLSDHLVGDSPQVRQMLALIERVAPSGSTVLITGETGVGKEMAAKLLHARSPRRDRPFVTVECAALQETLLQSELFGHERGAFTGADRSKPGLFEVAHGGTVFLDEIGEISQTTQVKLLRVLDTGAFRHVGATAELHVDVRIIAATNRDLQAMVRQGLFREDLFYRLSTITISVPALRERRDDVPRLAQHFTSMLNERFGTRKRLSEAAVEALSRHDWPGNVRELLHVVESALVICDGDEVRPEHLPAAVRVQTASNGGSEAAGFKTLEELERAHIRAVLQATAGHRGRAAHVLGISERNLYRKLREYELL